MTRARLAVAAVVALALAGLAAPGAASARSVPYGFFGTNDGATFDAPPAGRTDNWNRLASAGVESMRTVFSWERAQPRPGGLDLSFTDRIVADASRRRISLLPVVIDTPAWARKYSASAASPPRSNALYTAYLRALIRRYGSSGSFWRANPRIPKRPIRDWQIWNEPNIASMWLRARGEDWARTYGSLVRASYATVKGLDRGAKVVLAGLPNESWDDLNRLYKRGGIRGHFDIAAVHPYVLTPSTLLDVIAAFRGVMKLNRDGSRPIWVTEMGWVVRRSGVVYPPLLRGIVTSERGVATRLTQSYARLATEGRRLGVQRAFWYTWATAYAGDNFQQYMGLVRFDGGRTRQLMPAFFAFRSSARRYEGCVKTTAGLCR